MTTKVLENIDKYIIFYSKWCKYSMDALNLLKKKKVSYKSYDIDKIEGNLEYLLEDFKKNKNKIDFDITHRTRPVIFKYGKFIGGFTDLQKIL